MRIHTCPHCELRFADEPELADHLERDHGVDRVYLDRVYRLARGMARRRRVPDPTHVVHADPHRDLEP